MTSHSPPKNTRRAILDAADTMVNGQRATDYGKPEDNFARITELWNSHLRNRGIMSQSDGMSTVDVAILLILLKIARLAHSPSHKDSWIDIAGYAACGAECAGVKP